MNAKLRVLGVFAGLTIVLAACSSRQRHRHPAPRPLEPLAPQRRGRGRRLEPSRGGRRSAAT